MAKSTQFATCPQCFHRATAITASFSSHKHSALLDVQSTVVTQVAPFMFSCSTHHSNATLLQQAIHPHAEAALHFGCIHLCSQALCNMDYAPTSFWRWLSEASVAALKDAKEAIERKIANREDQEKQAFLQFWKDHPVPCNRRCRYRGDQACPVPCAHTSTDPDQWMHHSTNEWHRCAAHWFL